MPNRPPPTPRPVASLWPSLLMLLAALGSLGVADWQALRRLEQVSAVTEQRARARNGRLFLAQSLSAVKDLEIGVRGFAITGKDEFLEPYVGARAALPEMEARLRSNLNLPLPSGQSLGEMEALVARRLVMIEQVVALRRSRSLSLQEAQALFEEGKAVMDALRAHYAVLDAHQLARIEAFQAQVQDLRTDAQRASAVATALGLMLAGGALLLLLRERRRRQEAQALLVQSHAELDARVVARTADLDAARSRITAFAAEQDRAIEAERRRLAREVHDQIGQVFTAIKLIVSGLPGAALPPKQAQALDDALKLGVATSRRITAELRPPLLDELGLAAALRHHVPALLAPAGLHAKLDVHDDARLHADQALSLFRIVQEALTNVLRHAQAQNVGISGAVLPDHQHYRLQVQDDGLGLAAAPPRVGALGLTGMRERAAWHGGHLDVSVAPGGGTLVTVTLPLPARDEVPAG